MAMRQGVQAEVLLSLALVMVTGTALLAAVFLDISHSRIESLHGVLGRGFAAQVQNSAFEISPTDGGLWWRIERGGRVSGVNVSAETLDDKTRSIALEVLEGGDAVVVSGAPWDAIRFAAPDGGPDGVVAGRIEAPASGLVLAALVVVDVLIFGLFGVTLLRRRVVGPLHRLSNAVREMGDRGLPGSGPGMVPGLVPVEGVGEIESLGRAFNEMQNALAARTGSLEKAVLELRSVNADLIQARDGLDRAERLAMVGHLAAGVAHEVGNPMGALLAFLDVASRDTGLGEEGRRCLDRASEQGERVRIILRQLLDFSRPPAIQHRPFDLEEVARQVIDLISAQKEYCELEFEIEVEEGVGDAQGDSSIASQILLNLALNAASAMKDCERKMIRFGIGRTVRHRREGESDDDPSLAFRDDAILCRIEDSGPGVQLPNPQRIFDPFFTTKAPGEGTGLGLANARRLAEEMGGRVELNNQVSSLGGARFEFVLGAVGDESQMAKGEPGIQADDLDLAEGGSRLTSVRTNEIPRS